MAHRIAAATLGVAALFYLAPVISASPDSSGDDIDDREPSKHNTGTTDPTQSPTLDLPPVEVRGTASIDHIGEVHLTREDILRMQDGNGDLNRLLRNLPNVQFDENLSDADNLGEITAARVSIAGGRFYENRFSVDGISTNSALDPASDAPTSSVNDVPGFAQSQFFDTDIIESLAVYDSNAPASVGGFTGGAVLAETRSPGFRRGASAFISGTGDELVNLKVIQPPPPDDENPVDIEIEDAPRYRKLRMGASFDQPIGEHAGLLFSATRLTSDIPTLTLAEFREQHRENANLLAKTRLQLGRTDLAATATYTPYTSDQFIIDALNSDFTTTGGGGSLLLEGSRITTWGTVDVALSHAQSETNRMARQSFINWLTSSNGPDWGEAVYSLHSREGGFGDIDKTQQNTRLELSLDTGLFGGRMETGLSVERVAAGFTRDEDAYVYSTGEVDSRIRCVGDNVPACISGNQALYSRSVYPTDDVDVALTQAATHASWRYEREHWSTRLGLRLDVDDYQRNWNLAPRLLFTATPWDFLGLHAGANRYYSQALLTYKLREARAPFFSQYREATGANINGSPVKLVDNNWLTSAGAGRFLYTGSADSLSTPYSDELSGGLSLDLWGFNAGLRLTRRWYRDEFAQDESPEDPDTGLITLTPNNAGEGRYQGIVFAISRNLLPTVNLSANVTWSETERSNDGYDTRSASEFEDTLVYYNDTVVPLGRVNTLATDFARPVVVNLTLNARIGPRLDVSLTGRYRGEYRNVEDTGRSIDKAVQRCPACEQRLEELPIYGVITRRPNTLFDAKLRYRQPVTASQFIEFEAIIDNLFNARTYTASGADAYEAGIGAWLLLRYRYGGGTS